jgi:Secretion system C-terminal sorting domain/Putative serine esterase (DUF676)
MKKNILKLLFLAICSFCCTAQSQVTFTGLKKDYTQSMDSLLNYVNKAPITTGILYDRVMPFAKLDMLKLNGSTTTSNYQNFIQSWSELYRAAYNPTFLSLENLKTNIKANTNVNLVDIGIINTKINGIDAGRTLPSMFFTNGRFWNISGVNPFLERQVTVISPLKEIVTSSTITFRLLPSFILQLSGLPIKTLVADFGTGTSYNLITNGAITTVNPTINFSTNGKKEFVFTVVFSNNTSETLKANMIVDLPVINTTNTARSAFDTEENFVGIAGIDAASAGNLGFKGYNEATATKGVLEYRTYYSLVNNNGSAASKIKKEIIILDGFDPGDGRKIYKGSAGYLEEKSSIYELMYYDIDNDPYNNNSINLVEKLRNAPYGFDVTLVNFPNGTDYVERNAMALVALLNRENAKLATNGSSEKISIIGPSMGGLVSRYALAYMEKNGMNHNTKLWISFDSPHLGANIPISLQENLYFYGYFGQQEKAKDKFNENFRSPAARQMLIEQLDGRQEEAPYPTNLFSDWGRIGQNSNSRFRQLFQNNLNSNGLAGSNGYPKNLRKVALINGTLNGSKTNIEGQMILELAGFKPGFFKALTIEDRNLSGYTGFSQTFAAKVSIPQVLVQIFGTQFPRPPLIIESTIIRPNFNTKGCMDVVQGGTFKTQDIIQSEFQKALTEAGVDAQWRANLHNHAFIPSISSLAFKNPDFDWSNGIYRNLVCDPLNKEIEFDSYFAPKVNEDHVFVSSESADWIIKELTGNPQLPYFPIEENLIRGNPYMCNDKIETYTIYDICKTPSPVKYNNQAGIPVNGWSVEGNIVIISSTPYTVTVKGTSDVLSDGKIIATYQNGLQSVKLVKIGIPVVANQTITGGYDNVGIGSSSSLSLSSNVAGATNYRWTVTALSTNISCGCTTDSNGLIYCPPSVIKPKFSETGTAYFESSFANATIDWGNCPGMYLVTCYAKSACGSTFVNIKNVVVFGASTGGGGNPCPGSTLRIYPNPVKNGNIEVNIIPPVDPCNNVLNSGFRTTNLAKENDIKIYDLMGFLVFSKKYYTDSFSISNINLKKGNYILNITTEMGKTLKEIVIVE